MDRLKKLQERAEKKRKQQREYYQQNIDHLRARAKLYRDRWTDEQRRKKRERDLAYYHRTKNLIARRRRLARQERSDDQRENEKQQRRVRNRTEYAREKHRRDSKKFYYKHREVILQRQREYYRNHSAHILAKQREYKQKREAKKWDPLHLLAEVCRQARDGTSNGSCNDASTSADVAVSSISPSTLPCTLSSEKRMFPPEPFPFSRQALDTAIELL